MSELACPEIVTRYSGATVPDSHGIPCAAAMSPPRRRGQAQRTGWSPAPSVGSRKRNLQRGFGIRVDFLTGFTGLPGLKRNLPVEKPRRFPGPRKLSGFRKRLTVPRATRMRVKLRVQELRLPTEGKPRAEYAARWASGLTVFGSLAWRPRLQIRLPAKAGRIRRAPTLVGARIRSVHLAPLCDLCDLCARTLCSPVLPSVSLSARNLGLSSVTSVGKSDVLA